LCIPLVSLARSLLFAIPALHVNFNSAKTAARRPATTAAPATSSLSWSFHM
jgi:hypothetical protein